MNITVIDFRVCLWEIICIVHCVNVLQFYYCAVCLARLWFQLISSLLHCKWAFFHCVASLSYNFAIINDINDYNLQRTVKKYSNLQLSTFRNFTRTLTFCWRSTSTVPNLLVWLIMKFKFDFQTLHLRFTELRISPLPGIPGSFSRTRTSSRPPPSASSATSVPATATAWPNRPSAPQAAGGASAKRDSARTRPPAERVRISGNLES